MVNIRQQILGQNIRRYRHTKGITQERLAEIVDVSGSYIGYLERGEKNPSLNLLFKIADTLEIEPAILLTPPEGTANSELQKLIRILSDKDAITIKFIYEVAAAYFKSLRKS